MEIHKKLRKSKIFIALLIACVLVFSYEVNKPKAFAPLPFLVAIGVGMAAETLVTMGVKAGSKAILKKQAYNYSEDIQRAGKFDWAGTNPYRNKDGSISLSPTANDRAKIAGLISGSLIGAGLGDDWAQSCEPLTGSAPSGEYGNKVGYFSLQVTEDGKNMKVVNNATGQVYIDWRNYSWASGIYIVTNSLSPEEANAIGYDSVLQVYVINANSGEPALASENHFNASDHGFLEENREMLANTGSELRECNGFYAPSTLDNVYPAPMDMSSSYKMPNHQQLSDIPFVIKNVLPASEEEGEISWGELEQYYIDNNLNFADVVDSNFDNYLENGNIYQDIYNIGEINNIYTDVNQKEKVDEFNPPTGENNPIDPDDNLPSEPITDVAPINRGILQVITESYAYLADSVDTAIEAMKNITDGATGIVNYLDQAFRWLPAEWRALFGAAFILGVFAHFFRR